MTMAAAIRQDGDQQHAGGRAGGGEADSAARQVRAAGSQQGSPVRRKPAGHSRDRRSIGARATGQFGSAGASPGTVQNTPVACRRDEHQSQSTVSIPIGVEHLRIQSEAEHRRVHPGARNREHSGDSGGAEPGDHQRPRSLFPVGRRVSGSGAARRRQRRRGDHPVPRVRYPSAIPARPSPITTPSRCTCTRKFPPWIRPTA